MKKQLLCILLVVAMVISVMPVSVFAEDITSGSSQTESYGEFTDGAQIISDMIDKNGMYAHPRIIMSKEKFAKLRENIGQDSVTAILLEKLRGEADRHLNEAVCQYEMESLGGFV